MINHIGFSAWRVLRVKGTHRPRVWSTLQDQESKQNLFLIPLFHIIHLQSLSTRELGLHGVDKNRWFEIFPTSITMIDWRNLLLNYILRRLEFYWVQFCSRIIFRNRIRLRFTPSSENLIFYSKRNPLNCLKYFLALRQSINCFEIIFRKVCRTSLNQRQTESDN